MSKAGQLTSIKDERSARSEGATVVDIWLAKIHAQKTDKRVSAWRKAADEARVIFESGELDEDAEKTSAAQLFYSNVQVMAPSIYNTTPIPDIRVKFNDLDEVAKRSADIYERVATTDLDECDIDSVVIDAVVKGQVVGEGISRIRYEASIEEVPEIDPTTGQPFTNQDGTQMMRPEIVDDRVWPEIVPWDRIIFGPGRVFRKVRWIAFEHDVTYEEVVRLNKEIADTLTFGSGRKITGRELRERDGKTEDIQDGILSTIKAYEIWDLSSRTVIWISQDCKDIIKQHRDPFRLRQFFPIPAPFCPRSKMDSRLPQVPYSKHRRLYNSFDSIIRRIDALIGLCKVTGWADAKVHEEVAKIKDLTDGEFVSSKLAEAWVKGQGGSKLSDAICFWPVETIVKVIQQLNNHATATKALIWEIVGVADIMRGSSNPNETLGAQELKAQYGSMRLRTMQNSASEYAGQIINLMVEVRANMTPWKRLKEISRFDFAPTQEMLAQAQQQAQQQLSSGQQLQVDPATGQPAIDPATGQPVQPQIDPAQLQHLTQQLSQQAASEFEEQVRKVCKSPHRHLVIDVETDSTIRADVSRDMEQFNGLITATSSFATAVAGLSQSKPEAIGPLFKVYASQARKFRLGSEGEDALDELAKIAGSMPVQQQQGVDPAQKQEAQDQRQHESSTMQQQLQLQQMKNDAPKAKADAGKLEAQTKIEVRQFEDQLADRQMERDMIIAQNAPPEPGPYTAGPYQHLPTNTGSPQ